MEAETDNTLRDLHNSSDDTKAEFNNCFIIHSKFIIPSLKTSQNTGAPNGSVPHNICSTENILLAGN